MDLIHIVAYTTIAIFSAGLLAWFCVKYPERIPKWIKIVFGLVGLLIILGGVYMLLFSESYNQGIGAVAAVFGIAIGVSLIMIFAQVKGR